MRLMLAAIVATLMLPMSVQAQSARELAGGLGRVFAGEVECGLHFDQKAITAFIRQHVSAEDMEFTKWLSYYEGVGKTELEEISSSGKVAYCAQTEQIATTYGFLTNVDPGEPSRKENAAPDLPDDKLSAAKGTAMMLAAERHCDGIALDHEKIDRMIAIEAAVNSRFEKCARESCRSEAEAEMLAMNTTRRDAHCTYWRQTIGRIGLARN